MKQLIHLLTGSPLSWLYLSIAWDSHLSWLIYLQHEILFFIIHPRHHVTGIMYSNSFLSLHFTYILFKYGVCGGITDNSFDFGFWTMKIFLDNFSCPIVCLSVRPWSSWNSTFLKVPKGYPYPRLPKVAQSYPRFPKVTKGYPWACMQ